MSVHAARVLISWRTSSGSSHNFCVSLWNGVKIHELPVFSIEVNVSRGERKIAVVLLHHGATPESAVDATVDLHCKTVCFNKLFGNM